MLKKETLAAFNAAEALDSSHCDGVTCNQAGSCVVSALSHGPSHASPVSPHQFWSRLLGFIMAQSDHFELLLETKLT